VREGHALYFLLRINSKIKHIKLYSCVEQCQYFSRLWRNSNQFTQS
jgi:hypothetical protein